jgi:hypothetical protein
MIQPIFWTNLNGAPTNSFVGLFSKPTTATSEATANSVWPVDGVFRNLIIELDVAPGSGKSRTFMVRKNGADTGLTFTVSDLATSGQITGVDLSVAAGDRLCLRCTSSGAPSSVTNWRAIFEFESTNPGESGYSGNQGLSFNGSTRYDGVFLLSGHQSTSGSVSTIASAPGTITAIYAAATSAPSAGQGATLTIFKNGVKQDGTGGTVNTTTVIHGAASGSGTFSLPVAAGDELYLEIVWSASAGTIAWSFGVRFVADTDGDSQLVGHRMGSSLTADRFYPVRNYVAGSGAASESGLQLLHVVGITGFTLGNLCFKSSAVPGSGKTRTIALRKNAADAGPTVTLGAADQSGIDPSGAAFATGDEFCMRNAGTGALASHELKWALTMSTATDPAPTTYEYEGDIPIEVGLGSSSEGPAAAEAGLLIEMCFGGSYRQLLREL